MKKIGLLMLVVAGLLVAAPTVSASSNTATRACPTKQDKALSLRVHNLACAAAYKAITTGNRGYKCKDHGTKLPIPVTCTNERAKPRVAFYTWLFRGG